MLELTDVAKSFGPTRALAPVSLKIDARKTTVLIGPSGCGKSTLIGLMNGLIRPDQGSVLFDSTPVTAASASMIRRRMGYVIQDGGLFPHLDAGANVSLMARHIGWSRGEIQARIEELADLTRFPKDALARYPVQLSGGQRQRVSLMRGLMLDPDVLLLDEPLGALDPMIRAELQTDLKAVFGALNKTVVLVTHDIGEAGFFADLIVLMREGAILQTGTLHDLVNSPADPFVTRFINAQRAPFDALRGNGG